MNPADKSGPIISKTAAIEDAAVILLDDPTFYEVERVVKALAEIVGGVEPAELKELIRRVAARTTYVQ